MDVIDADVEQELRTIEREYTDFFDDANDENIYASKIKDLIREGKTRLIVNVNDLRKRFPTRALKLLQDSVREVSCIQRALKDTVAHVDLDYGKLHEEFYVAFEGSFGQRHVNPRTLKSIFLNNMVCCEGIVTKCSLVHPKVARSVHYCPQTKKTLEKRYTDLTSFDSYPSGSVYPKEDENHNALETEFGLSKYKDHQTFCIQEMPEIAPAGQLPRSADVIADNDLADMCKPGDRVRIIGVFRCLPSKQGGVTSGTFRTVIIANNIQILTKDIQELYTNEDIKTIRHFVRTEKNVFNILARSLAPSIQGHDEIKQAILAMLLGGVEKVLPNGTRLRGDINILLIGDPSVAKSQLLRYVLHTAPRAIATTGRGSSGVGLTAAVTTDPESGDRRLEAGAMVLGDRGVVCIDEFDKMTDIDRTAIHEVMEQGRVSIAKAGIHAKLNARCAVLAAANPVYGRYDDVKSPMENIGMQDSLLSRFDLLFIVLDEHNAERDHVIAEHVIKMHCYRAAGEEDGAIMDVGVGIEALTTEDLNKEEETALEVFEKNIGWLPPSMEKEKIVTSRFLRKFFALAKCCKPKLTDKASAYIAEKYADLRAFDEKKSEKERTMPVTARMLETMIRLSTAFAKSRISKEISQQDAEKAYQLLCYACFKEKTKERRDADGDGSKKRRHRRNEDEDSATGNQSNAHGEGEHGGDEPSGNKKPRPDGPGGDVFDYDETDTEGTEPMSFQQLRAQSKEIAAVSLDRLALFKRSVRQIFDKQGVDQLPLDDVIGGIQKEMGPRKFTDGEVKAALEKMSDDNALMVSEGKMILI